MNQPTKPTKNPTLPPQIIEWIVFVKHEYLWGIPQNTTVTYWEPW